MFKIKSLVAFLLCLSLFFGSVFVSFAQEADAIIEADPDAAANAQDEAAKNADPNTTGSALDEQEDQNPKIITPVIKPRIKKNFIETYEFPKGKASERAFYALLQWGYIDTLGGDKTQMNWDIEVSIDNGKIQLMGDPFLFEGNDEVTEADDKKKITGITKTSRHWDGILLRITPHDKEETNKVRLQVGALKMDYPIKDFFALHGLYELKNGRQVAVRSFHKDGHLSLDRRVNTFNRKFAVLEQVSKVHLKVKELLEKGKLTNQQVAAIFNVLKKLENHEYALSKGQKWTKRLEIFVKDIERDGIGKLASKIQDLNSEFENSCMESALDDYQGGLVPFEDTPQCAWYTDYARRLRNAQVVRGMAGTNLFAPANNISRAEILTMALSAAGIDISKVSDEEISDDIFSDSLGHWAERGIRYAFLQNLIKGFSDDTFRPNHPVTRAEALAIVYKVFGLDAGDICSGEHFNDVTNHWGCAIVEDAKLVGIVNGFDDGTFKPNDPITRAAMAKVISTTVDYIQITDDYDEL